MKRTDIIIIGAGQAGLAMSHRLGARGIDHVLLERGRVGERWRSERWESLRLLTPRWQSRLPGWSYQGADPDGFMTMPEVIRYLDQYARSFTAPVHAGVKVTCVQRLSEGFRVQTDAGVWYAPAVVLATGYCDVAHVPAMASNLPDDIAQVVPGRYRTPSSLRDGGVLIVGASSTGVQLASEIARSGRPVTLAAGRHTRLPRRYRGRDILAWFDVMGISSQRSSDVVDLQRSRTSPSLQLIGSDDARSIDLGTLQKEGVRVVGRVAGMDAGTAYIMDDLGRSTAAADEKMHRLLDGVDRYITGRALEAQFPAGDRPDAVPAPPSPRTLRLAGERIRTIVWATGYRRDYGWLRVPVLDARGEIVHEGGITPVPGLYALGLYFMRRRNSSLIDGVGADAEDLAGHIDHYLSRRLLHAA